METKGKIISLFLELVGRHVPLGQARLATLGGWGMEAEEWQKAGVLPENGWLIERNKDLRRKLIRRFRYRILNQLRALPQFLAGCETDEASVDAFHLDLCGMLSDSAISDFTPVLPLVLKGRGRCLAITIADARRNTVLEEWPEFLSRAHKLFGRKARTVFDRLMEQQKLIPVNPDAPALFKPFDPEKAAKREFGLLIELAELLFACGVPWALEEMRRYVYVSHHRSGSCRMRTYFFRMDNKPARWPAANLINTWTNSPLFFANRGTFHEVVAQAPALISAKPKLTAKPIVKGKTTMKAPNASRLAALAHALGGPEEAEYEALVMKSRKLEEFQRLLESASAADPNTAAAIDAPARPKKFVKRGRQWRGFSKQEQIEWLLKALELKASSNGDWPKIWQDHIASEFERCSPSLIRSMHSVFARANGKFRPKFQARIQQAFGQNAQPYLDRLAALPV
jgi:hypothetical protein